MATKKAAPAPPAPAKKTPAKKTAAPKPLKLKKGDKVTWLQKSRTGETTYQGTFRKMLDVTRVEVDVDGKIMRPLLKWLALVTV